MVDDDAVDFVGDVLECIHHALEVLEHLAGDGELQRVGPCGLERTLQSSRVDLVGFSFEANILADNSLLLAFLKGQRQITRELALAVAADRRDNLERKEAIA